MKLCSACQSEKDFAEFYKDKAKKDGHASTCKTCSNERAKRWSTQNPQQRSVSRLKWAEENPEAHKLSKQGWKQRNKAAVMAGTRKRQAALLNRIPVWYSDKPVRKIYEKAKQYGFHVDHIVPLQSDLVCGLHVFDNLQLMHPSENCAKNNKFWPYMP